MRALTYHGSHDVRVETVPDPTIVEDDDIILKVTSTAICGSDLHLYRGSIPKVKQGDIFGHEFLGAPMMCCRSISVSTTIQQRPSSNGHPAAVEWMR